MPAADRGEPRTSVPRIAREQRHSASHFLNIGATRPCDLSGAAIAIGSDASQGLAAAAIRGAQMAHGERRGAAEHADRVRHVQRAGAQAPAWSLRSVHAKGATGAWPPRDLSCSQGARSASRSRHRSAPQRRRERSARPGDQRGASSQSQLGARTSGPTRRGLVQARDRAKLDAFSLAEIAAATGLSLAACLRVRAGARVPHPRHWEALRNSRIRRRLLRWDS